MPRPRKTLINTQDTPYYHCISRCVRRAFLCGDDQFSGKNYDHRKAWLVNRIHQLASIFAIDICAYAVMSNHYHIVLHINDEEVNNWSNDQVLSRWSQLFKGPLIMQRYLNGGPLSNAEYSTLSDCIEIYRSRLSDVSWFMRCLNEPIARDANVEDQCSGRFWEGRFKSQALLDETALLSCMAYVDLNPVRAGISDTLEHSDFTSIQQRLFEFAKRKPDSKSYSIHKTNKSSDQNSALKPLFPFVGNEHIQKTQPGLFFSEFDYFELIDWTGRAIRDDKRGHIPHSVIPILEKLKLPPDIWLDLAIQPHKKTFRQLNAAA